MCEGEYANLLVSQDFRRLRRTGTITGLWGLGLGLLSLDRVANLATIGGGGT